MHHVRRRFLCVAGGAVAMPVMSRMMWAQALQTGPKATQILRQDLDRQGQKVEETVATVVEFPPGSTAPWHYHPGAQEIFYALEGSVFIDVEGQGAKSITPGDIGLIPADIAHSVRNESTSVTARAFVVHSRSEKGKPLRVDGKKA